MVYRSLAVPVLIDGAEPRLMLVNIGLAAFFVVTLKTFGLAFLPVSWGLHKVIQVMGKKDPFLRRAYLVYMRQADRYEPWPEKQPKRSRRPTNIGSGIVG